MPRKGVGQSQCCLPKILNVSASSIIWSLRRDPHVLSFDLLVGAMASHPRQIFYCQLEIAKRIKTTYIPLFPFVERTSGAFNDNIPVLILWRKKVNNFLEKKTKLHKKRNIFNINNFLHNLKVSLYRLPICFSEISLSTPSSTWHSFVSLFCRSLC